MDVLQRDFCRHDSVGRRVHRQMQLAPDPTLVMAVFSHLPFALAEHLQAGGIDNQIGDLTLGWLPVWYLDRAGSLARLLMQLK